MTIPVSKINSAEKAISKYITVAVKKFKEDFYKKQEHLNVYWEFSDDVIKFTIINKGVDGSVPLDELLKSPDEFLSNSFKEFRQKAKEFELTGANLVGELDFSKIIPNGAKTLKYMAELIKENPKLGWKYIKGPGFNHSFEKWLTSYIEIDSDPSVLDPLEDYQEGFYGSETFRQEAFFDLFKVMVENKTLSFRSTIKVLEKFLTDYRIHLSDCDVENVLAEQITCVRSKDLKVVELAKKLLPDYEFTRKEIVEAIEFYKANPQRCETLDSCCTENESSDKFYKEESLSQVVYPLNFSFFKKRLDLKVDVAGKVSNFELSETTEMSIYRHLLNDLKHPSINKISGVVDYGLMHMKNADGGMSYVCVLSVNNTFNESKFQDLLSELIEFKNIRVGQNPGTKSNPFSAIEKSPEEKENLNKWYGLKSVDCVVNKNLNVEKANIVGFKL